MKKEKYKFLFIALLMLMCYSISALAQSNPHELFIPPPTGPGQFLDQTILADTNSNGTRKDPDRVYVLQRGGEYLVGTFVRNTNWVLRIKAQDGPGKNPIIYLFPNATTGKPPGYFIHVSGDVYLKNLAISGIVEADPAIDPTNYIGGMQGALISTNSPGKNIYIDSCLLTNTNGNHVRTDQAPITVKITNSLFTNMGYLGTSNLGAGKAVDLRAGSCDSLIMINNTFINWQDRIIRHHASTAPIRYMNFDHNTLVNGMSYHGLLSLGKTGKEIKITNNLFIDPFALGSDTDAVRQAEFTDHEEKDAYGNPKMVWIYSSPNDTTVFKIANNYYCISTEGQKFLTDNHLSEGAILTDHIKKKLGADSSKAFKKVSLTLPNVPKLMTTFMTWYRDPNGGNKTKSTTNWSAKYDYDRRTIKYYRDTMNCAYSTSHEAYTGSQGGFPVGDLNWFPTKKVAWESYVSAVEKLDDGIIPVNYVLDQNYPNPFNPSTTITYSLPAKSTINLKIYNALGQEVVSLVNNEIQEAGKYKVVWNGKDATGKTMATGVYFYSLKAEGVNLIKKMLLIK
ncbi:MAG TPA: T9SS type A sorting domain-containing protein [Bacteroidota bacterium]|nr:T9SS type A sorting domain-containing protein [Bacteroidota bacterium]